MLEWTEVERAFAGAPRYWIATTNTDGSPHAIQQWGAFMAGTLYFEGGKHTLWARNLARDPRLAVTTEAAGLAVMLEGRVEWLTPDAGLAQRIIAAYAAKRYGYTPQPANWEGDGLVAARATTVFAWRFDSFNETATRFRFD
jgi:hypothetical protein